jgi:sterol O-acyltransferase
MTQTTTTSKSLSAPAANPRAHVLDENQARGDLAHRLAQSPSTSSLASTQSSTGPETPSSSEGYHTISTTSIVTTRKRKVRRPTFEARSSRLDPEMLTKNQDPFRGFHTLFWIVMGAYGLITFEQNWTKVGRAFGGTGTLFSSFSQDAIILAISDLGLVLSTGVALLLIKTIAKGWIRYRVTGMVIQHCVQVLFLLFAIAWAIWR